MLRLLPRSANLIGGSSHILHIRKTRLVFIFNSFKNNHLNFDHQGLVRQSCTCGAPFKNIVLENVSYMGKFIYRKRQKLQEFLNIP